MRLRITVWSCWSFWWGTGKVNVGDLDGHAMIWGARYGCVETLRFILTHPDTFPDIRPYILEALLAARKFGQSGALDLLLMYADVVDVKESFEAVEGRISQSFWSRFRKCLGAAS
ncbi:hypothetical protein BC829DRAFT_106264 [Chytridium lagenaria]|nr:hypothetical protein BC829DRAFT_106264 [Chytridium lagenaria]